MRTVTYLRYSSHNQDEFSIEGQRQECMAYITKEGLNFVGEYCDRARSGTKDDRKDFLRMINDGKKGLFDCVVVYKLDRFARNRYDSAVYKRDLKKNNIKVVSAVENIAEGKEGVILESVLEGMAEYFSLNLGENVKRGMGLNAEYCYYNGGTVPVGFTLETIRVPNPSNPEKPIIKKKYILDEEKAPYMLKSYEMYAERTPMCDIIAYLKRFGITTAEGKPFNRSSLRRIFTNKKYKGVYSYNGVETPDGIPRIVSDELFQRVQDELARNNLAPGRNRAKTEYLLTTKLICGECKGKMTGKSGTSKTKKLHTYYKCVNADSKKEELCSNKKSLRQNDIEELVVLQAQKFITSDNISYIANEIAKISKEEQDDSRIKFLEKSIKKDEKMKVSALRAIVECGDDTVARKVFIDEVSRAERLKVQHEQELLVEQSKREEISARELMYFFKRISNGKINDHRYRKMLINTLINRVIWYYNKVVIVINVGGAEREIEISLVDNGTGCSPSGALALPIREKVEI